MKLMIATPAMQNIFCGEYVASLLATQSVLARENIHTEWYYDKGISEISRGRDGIAAHALRQGMDKLLFIDADEGWNAEDVVRLIKSDKAIIGGSYPKKEYPLNINFGVLPQHRHYFPTVAKYPEEFAEWVRCEADKETGEIEIAFLPTGFMLIDCSVFLKLQEFAPKYLTRNAVTAEELTYYEYFPIGVINGYKDTEDWGFCRFARSCGFGIWLNTHCIADHIGNHTFRIPNVHRTDTSA